MTRITDALSRRAFLQRSLAAGAAVGAPALLRNGAARPPQTLQQKVGQLFVVSMSGTQPSAAFLSFVERRGVGGVVLFERNCASVPQTQSMLTHLQAASAYPLLVGVDQEGGLVVRIRHGAPVFPAEAQYGRVGSVNAVYSDAATTARDLHALGLSVNLAPVVDVLSNPSSPIGTRSYGSNPQLGARLAVAAIGGYQQHGMAAVAKHFIGLGHTSIDSHDALPTVRLTLPQLEKVDLVPFRAAISAGVAALLVAHVALPAIDPVRRPASLSPVVINGLVRKHLGYRGVVLTDSLVMGALPAGHGPEAAEQAFAAGADILLLAANYDIPTAVFEDGMDRIVAAVRAGRIPQSRLDEAVGRIVALKSRYPALRAPHA